MTVQRFAAPDGTGQVRARDADRKRAADVLGGRTVWSAAGPTGRHTAAQDLCDCLTRDGEGRVATRRLHVRADEDVLAGAGALDRMLDGERSGSLETLARTAYRDRLVGRVEVVHDVGPDDVVVLHDALTAVVADAVRACGAHAVLVVAAGPPRETAHRARGLLAPFTAAVDAYLMAWRPTPDWERTAVLIPSPGLLAAKDGPGTRPERDAAWRSALAEVAWGDRGDIAGGRRHPRPVVAAR